MNAITNVLPLDAEEAARHFERRLRYEADCWDTHEALKAGNPGFVLLDVRSHELYELSHIPGAISLPHGKIINSKMKAWRGDALFVVYCAGPHCNGANKAAIKLAKLGRSVKEMIGGMTGWADEGFDFAHGTEPGTVND